MYSKNYILSISPSNGNDSILDFNRFRYHYLPSTRKILNTDDCEYINRDILINELVKSFKNSDKSDSTLLTLYNTLIRHFKYSDEKDIQPLTKKSIYSQINDTLIRYKSGTIKSSIYINLIANLSSIFELLDQPAYWLKEIPKICKNDTEPYESYSKEELKLILPPLRSLFSQLSAQFLSNPRKHIKAYKNNSTMTFKWNGKTHKIYGSVSKLMASATFLLSYYTWSNTSVIFNLKQPKNVSFNMGRNWYIMPAFKRRAFKTITVEITEHQSLEIPKYSISFFNTLLKVSKIIDSSDDALLFQRVIANERSRVTSAMLSSFNMFMAKTLNLRGYNQEIIPYQISRFRETGAQTFMIKEDTIKTSILLDNQPNTIKKHYSKGNKLENRAMMQDSTSTLEIQSRLKTNVNQAIEKRKEELNVNILTLEEKLSNLSKNINGTYCKDPFGKESESFTKKAVSHNLLSKGEKLACANILQCFSCHNQVIVQSEYDIWCLLSFKENIEESISYHLNNHHFEKNFSSTLDKIKNIIYKIDKNILRKAERRLQTHGRHPLWNTNSTILDLSI